MSWYCQVGHQPPAVAGDHLSVTANRRLAAGARPYRSNADCEWVPSNDILGEGSTAVGGWPGAGGRPSPHASVARDLRQKKSMRPTLSSVRQLRHRTVLSCVREASSSFLPKNTRVQLFVPSNRRQRSICPVTAARGPQSPSVGLRPPSPQPPTRGSKRLSFASKQATM